MVLAACIVLVQLSWLLPAAVAAQIHDLNITDLVLCDGKGGGADGAPTIVWSPSIVVSKQNVTLAVAQAQWKQGRNLVKAEGVISRSTDGGLNFSPDRVSLPGGAQLLASRLTNTIHAFGVAVPNASATALTRAISTDDGETWSTPVVLEDPFIVGEGGLNHGVELQRGPHRGRFLLPYAKASTSSDKYAAHALTLYSDTHGANWSMGALLPDYSGEAAITELANGSVLISFRNEGEHMPRHPHNRGFARSVSMSARLLPLLHPGDDMYCRGLPALCGNRTTAALRGPRYGTQMIGTLRSSTRLPTRESTARRRRARCTLGIRAQSMVTGRTTQSTARQIPVLRLSLLGSYIRVVLGTVTCTCCRRTTGRETGSAWRFSVASTTRLAKGVGITWPGPL